MTVETVTDPGVQAARDRHACTVTRWGQTQHAQLIRWGNRGATHGHGQQARVCWTANGASYTVAKTAVIPTPCTTGCDWCRS